MGNYGSYYNGPSESGGGGVSRLVSLVGDALQIGQQVEGFVSRRSKRKEDDQDRLRQISDDAERRRLADAQDTREEDTFTRAQTDAGYTKVPASGASPVESVISRNQDNFGSGVGSMLAGTAARRPSTWVKTQKSKQEEAAANRLAGQQDMEDRRVRASQDAETTRNFERSEAARQHAEDQRARDTETSGLRGELQKEHDARVAAEQAARGGPTEADREQGRAEHVLEFATSRRDRIVKARPDEAKFTDAMTGVEDVPRFQAARKAYVSDSTKVEHDVTGASNRVASSMGLPPEKAPEPYDDKATTDAAHKAIEAIKASALSDDEKKTRISTVNERLRKARGGQ